MSISTIRRQVKNVAYNFSDAQVKVREATSNDPWGPSTALMSEIADLTNNTMAFTEIMSIIWKRLNDSGKNWRHVYKSLVLLDFLIKCGNEKVAKQCRENIFTIETLKDFQHMEDNRDQGLNIREKAKQITSLLADDERLHSERQKFLLTRSKFKQGSSYSTNDWQNGDPRSEFDDARPSSLGEEEMQLQIALALSKEEHEKMDEMRKSDEVRLQLALEESRKEAERLAGTRNQTVTGEKLTQSALDDLLSLGLGQITVENTPSSSASTWNPIDSLNDPWGSPAQQQQPISSSAADPWAPIISTQQQPMASAPPPLPSVSPTTTGNVSVAPIAADPFSAWESQLLQPTPVEEFQTNKLQNMNSTMAASLNPTRKTPEHFLGENSSLVNLDNLFGTSNNSTPANSNPFLLGNQPAPATNPFAREQRKSPTLNEMRAAQQTKPPLPSDGPSIQGQRPW